MTVILRRSLMVAVTVVALLSLSAVDAVAAVTYLVTANTSSVSGSSGFIELQFNPGGGTSQLATAQIVSFTPGGGSLSGIPTISGDVTGALPGAVTFVNDTAFNDYYQGITFGSSVSFVLVLSGPAVDSPNGNPVGSSFFLSFFDSTGMNSILTNQTVTGVAGEVDINTSNGTVITTAFPNAGGGASVVSFSKLAADAIQVSYISNLKAGDSHLNLTNGGTDPAGNICANVYVFAEDEQLIACCTCPLTPNGLATLSAQNDLVSNTLTPGVPVGITMMLVASSGTCSAANVTAANLAGGLRAWGTTLHAAPGGGFRVTELPFLDVPFGAKELANITATCGFIQSNGSGYGICASCKPGAAGAKRQ